MAGKAKERERGVGVGVGGEGVVREEEPTHLEFKLPQTPNPSSSFRYFETFDLLHDTAESKRLIHAERILAAKSSSDLGQKALAFEGEYPLNTLPLSLSFYYF